MAGHAFAANEFVGETVVGWLVRQAGLDAALFEARGLGEQDPVARTPDPMEPMARTAAASSAGLNSCSPEGRRHSGLRPNHSGDAELGPFAARLRSLALVPLPA